MIGVFGALALLIRAGCWFIAGILGAVAADRVARYFEDVLA